LKKIIDCKTIDAHADKLASVVFESNQYERLRHTVG